MTPDFWLTSGFHLLERDARGHLVVTDDYLRAYWRRPELAPVEQSCVDERRLHAALMAEPRLSVADERLAALADADARDNYRVALALRDQLRAHSTLEAAYLAQFRPGPPVIAPLFLDQIVHAVLRNVLDGCTDPMRARAAELLFRKQKVRAAGDAIMLADEEVVEMQAAGAGIGAPAPLAAAAATVDLDVLNEANAGLYWERSDRFDMVLDIAFPRPGLDALCRVLEAWTAHFLGVETRIEPVQQITDARWVWHVGLDAEASRILNDLYDGREVGEERLGRILSLFRLEFREPAQMRADLAGRPVYLAIAMNAQKELQLKPQNLLVNLPLASTA